jgi:hypothetical protein
VTCAAHGDADALGLVGGRDLKCYSTAWRMRSRRDNYREFRVPRLFGCCGEPAELIVGIAFSQTGIDRDRDRTDSAPRRLREGNLDRRAALETALQVIAFAAYADLVGPY